MSPGRQGRGSMKVAPWWVALDVPSRPVSRPCETTFSLARPTCAFQSRERIATERPRALVPSPIYQPTTSCMRRCPAGVASGKSLALHGGPQPCAWFGPILARPKRMVCCGRRPAPDDVRRFLRTCGVPFARDSSAQASSSVRPALESASPPRLDRKPRSWERLAPAPHPLPSGSLKSSRFVQPGCVRACVRACVPVAVWLKAFRLVAA